MSVDKYNISYSLFGYDIKKILNNKVNIINYNTLFNINNIDEIFKYDSCIILYKTDTGGHWCYLLRHKKKNCIEFGDPYGHIMDYILKENINDETLKNYYNNNNHRLIFLMVNSNYKYIEYNNYKFQNSDDYINTCGRHCCVRVIYKELSLQQYYNNFKYYIDNHLMDYIVLKITNKFI